MYILDRILREIDEGMILSTPVGRNQFRIKSVGSDELVFSVAKRRIFQFQELFRMGFQVFFEDEVGCESEQDMMWLKKGLCSST